MLIRTSTGADTGRWRRGDRDNAPPPLGDRGVSLAAPDARSRHARHFRAPPGMESSSIEFARLSNNPVHRAPTARAAYARSIALGLTEGRQQVIEGPRLGHAKRPLHLAPRPLSIGSTTAGGIGSCSSVSAFIRRSRPGAVPGSKQSLGIILALSFPSGASL